MPILFNYTPGSGLVDPIFSFEINSAGLYSSVARMILIGHKTNAGTMAANTPVLCASQQDADAAAGSGSMLREMFRIARQNAPVQEIWLMHVAETGAAQTWTFTVGAPAVGAAGSGTVIIGGETLSISISAADTTTTIATAVAAAINNYYNQLTGAQLQVTATSAAAVVTVTARHLGAIFADTDISIPAITGNIFATASALTIASGTAGTGQPVLTSALAALGDDPWDFIVSPWSDSTSTAAYAALTNDTSGRWSYARQSYGHVWAVSTGNLSALATVGAALNDRHLTVIGRLTASVSPAYLWPAAIAARTAAWLSDYATGNVSRNQTGLVVQGLQAPRDRSTWLNYSARNTLVQTGISTWLGSLDGTVSVDKIVTCMLKGANNQNDATFRDVQSMYQAMHVVRILRSDLLNAFGGKAIAASNPGALGALVTTKDIASQLVNSYAALSLQGLVENTPGFSKNLQVQQNASNPNRVDVYLPIQRVKPLDVLAANATIFSNQIPG
jgi:phage tail sheath gpL-like